jgi:hypothetical protein
MSKLRQRRVELEKTEKELERREKMEVDAARSLEQLEMFCHHVAQGMDSLTFEDSQKLLQLVVEGVRVENGVVSVETIIPVSSSDGQLRARRPKLVEGNEWVQMYAGVL